MRRFLASFLLLFAAATVQAQSVRWEPSPSDDPNELQLVFEDCSPQDNRVSLPAIDGLTLTLASTGTQMSSINGVVTNLFVLTYRVRSQRNGTIQIPAFTVTTNKGAARVAAYNGGAIRAAPDTGTNSTLALPGNSLWAGEVFPLTYTLSVQRRYFNQLGSTLDWNAAPLVVEDWPKQPEALEATAPNGETRLNIVYKTRAYAKTPGRVTLNPAQQLVNLQMGNIGFGLFQQPRLEQISVTSNRPEFTVRPLPAGAPASFNGAVGQFTLTSKVVPEKAAVGEPITWTITLAGNGNWPDIPGLPARDVSRDFQVVQPQAKRAPAEGKLFDATIDEDVVLVPTRPGTYTLGPVAYTCFDPKSGTYKTITSEKFTVTVTAPPPPKPSIPTLSTDPAAGANPSTAASAPPPASPGLPAPIPRDPLPGTGHALKPLANPTLGLCVAAPFAGVLLFWLGLALRRAYVTDPLRPRREAHRRLTTTLAAFHSATDHASRARLLLAWQHDAAVLWKIDHAAPAAPTFHAGGAPEHARDWEVLWNESDRALYSANASLPADWIDRAHTALAAKRVNSFSSFQLFLPRNLLPFAATVVLCAAVVATAMAEDKAPAKDPVVAYQQGNFSAAEKSWRTALGANPTDWIARHDLSLALIQQDRAGEAAAHAAAAFVQQPRNLSVRWHLGPAFEKAGFTPAPLGAFVQPGPWQQSAQLASPAEWQWALVLAAVLAAGALSLWLLRAYGWKSAATHPAAITLLCLAVLLALAAVAAGRAYGFAADARAAIAWHAGTLRSIPTEADTAQKSTPLAAGSVAIINDRTFLGWVQLSFENGQTGWVRKEDVVPLWR